MSVLLAIGVLLASPEQSRTAPIELDLPKEWRIEIVDGKQQAPGALLVAVPAGGFKGLRVSSTPLVENERGVGADGELCVTLGSPRKKDDACTIQAGPADVPAGTREIAVYLEPRRFARTGDYRGELRFRAADIEGVSRANLRVVVSHGPLCPAAVIFAGVVLGALVAFLAGRFRTQQQLALRLLRLRGAVDLWKERAKVAPQDLLDLDESLRDADRENAAYILDSKAVDALETQAQQYKNKLAAARSPASSTAPKKTLWPSFLRTPGARLGTSEVLVAVVSAVVATCTGLLALYAMPFGRFDQYVGAFLWGFGIDSSVRGFRAVFQKLDGA